MKYFRNFSTVAEYNEFKNSEDYILPNVSYISEGQTVEYKPKKKITFRLNVSSTWVVYEEELTFTCNEGDTWLDVIESNPGLFATSSADGPYYIYNNSIFHICNDGPEINYAKDTEVIVNNKLYYAFKVGWQ